MSSGPKASVGRSRSEMFGSSTFSGVGRRISPGPRSPGWQPYVISGSANSLHDDGCVLETTTLGGGIGMFQCDEHFGNVTSCPSLLGTGIHITLRLFCPCLLRIRTCTCPLLTPMNRCSIFSSTRALRPPRPPLPTKTATTLASVLLPLQPSRRQCCMLLMMYRAMIVGHSLTGYEQQRVACQ